MEIIESDDYVPQVVGRRREADGKRREPTRKVRRWAVEVCHSWSQSLSQAAGAIREVEAQLRRTQLHRRRNSIAFRKVKLTVEIICQKGLSVANPDAGLLKAMWRNSRLGSQSPPDAQLCVRRCRRRRKRRLVPR